MKIRQQNEDDTNFIYHSWLRSYRNRADVIPYHWYYKIYQGVLDRILKRPAARVAVACHPEYSDQIFGFIAYEHTGPIPTVHYIYVKDPYRSNGIAQALLSFALSGNETFNYTFSPSSHSRVKKRGGSYKPRLVRIPLSEDQKTEISENSPSIRQGDHLQRPSV